MTRTTARRAARGKTMRALWAAVLCLPLISCFVPDRFSLIVALPDAGHVGWTYEGSLRFFFMGFDPRKGQLPAKDIAGITDQLKKTPGALRVTHVGGVEWRVAIAWNNPITGRETTFPSARGGRDTPYWLLKVTKEGPRTLVFETAHVGGRDAVELQNLGYTSKGTLTIETPGTVEQMSGAKLTRTWFGFGSGHTVQWGIYDEPIKLRVSW